MGPICALLGDANSQVRSCAMETIVNIYRHVGVKVRIDVSRRNLQQSHLAKLNAQFDAVDATTGNSKSDNEVCVCVYMHFHQVLYTRTMIIILHKIT